MTCPMCQKIPDARYRPFCSLRCADLDLGKWLAGTYAVASDADDDLEQVHAALSKEAEKPH